MKALLEKGTKFNTIPVLSFSHDGEGNAKVESHEGRHRARALKALGEKTIPVVLSSREGKGEGIRWGSQEEGNFDRLTGEFPTSLKGEDGRNTVSFPTLDPRNTARFQREKELEGTLVPTVRSVKMSQPARQKLDKVINRLETNIRKVAGKDVQFKPVQELQMLKNGEATPLRGVQTGNLIQVSMDFVGKKDLDETAFHEAWHYLREETGVFTSGEKKTLDASHRIVTGKQSP